MGVKASTEMRTRAAPSWRRTSGMICGLQAAVARAAGMLLEVFQQREVQVLVQRLGADDFLVDRQREVDAWQVDADLQALEVGFVGAPGMVAHRVDGGAERQLILVVWAASTRVSPVASRTRSQPVATVRPRRPAHGRAG